MAKRSIVRLFESRKGNLDFRVNRDYVRNGIATIPCRISDYSDVINIYSVKGFEIPNTEFIDYIKMSAEVTPPDDQASSLSASSQMFSCSGQAYSTV